MAPLIAPRVDVLSKLTFAERQFIALTQVNQIILALPRGDLAGQYGRMYSVALPEPQAVELFAHAELKIVDDKISVLWAGSRLGNTLHLRASVLLEALQYLAANNRHYRSLPGVTLCLRRWERQLAELRGEARASSDNAVSELDGEDRAARRDEEDRATEEVVRFTTEGPPAPTADVVELQRFRGMAKLEIGADERMFPHLFPDGANGYDGSSWADYCRRRLLGCDVRFQQHPEYVFWLQDVSLKKALSSKTSVMVGPAPQQPGVLSAREAIRKQVYAVLRGVPGTQAHLFAKRALALRMMAQLGPPSWFMTLTCHERQPQILLACALTHLRCSRFEEFGFASDAAVFKEAANAVDTLMNERGDWHGFSAHSLCKAYPAALAREFMRMLRDFLRWLGVAEDEHAATSERIGDEPEHDPLPGHQPQPPHRDLIEADKAVLQDLPYVDEEAKSQALKARVAHDEQPPFRAADYVCRIEWQKRGFPHAHMLLWVPCHADARNVPTEDHGGDLDEQDKREARRQPHDFGRDDDAESINMERAAGAETVPELYDRHVSTRSARRWLRVYRNATMADLSRRLEHKHSAYCGLATTGACRFGFPQPAKPNARLKDVKEMHTYRSKNRFFVRRRPCASNMGLYNDIMLRRWRGSMDLQFVRDGYAASKYILGYVLKGDDDKQAVESFEQHVRDLAENTTVDRQAVYRAAFTATQGRITSVPEACHLVLGLPVVLISRGNVWVQAGEPHTWVSHVPVSEELEAICQADMLVHDQPTSPAAHRDYMNRNTDGEVELHVEGGGRVSVAWADVSFFDFVAGTTNKGRSLRKRPAIVGHRTVNPDSEPEAYYYQKIILHWPWRQPGDWAAPCDGGSHRAAFERLLAQQPTFLTSQCFPAMDIRLQTARELARLQAALVVRCSLEGNVAQELLEGHMRLSYALRAHAIDQHVDYGHDEDATGTVAEGLFADVPGGEEAARTLAENPDTAQSKFVIWAVNEVLNGRSPRVLLHGPGGCGKSFAVKALVHHLRAAQRGVAVTAPTGCAAFQVGGSTLHSVLALPVINASYGRACDLPPPQGAVLQNLTEYWRRATAIVIDEVSMVSDSMFRIIDRNLQIMKRKHDVPFGGLAVFLVGDFYQLTPPKGLPAFAATHLWSLLAVLELEGNHRAAADPSFSALLSRARLAQQTAQDVAALQGRVLTSSRCAGNVGRRVRRQLMIDRAGARQYQENSEATAVMRPAASIAELVNKGAARLLATRAAVAEANTEMLHEHVHFDMGNIKQCPAEDIYVASRLPSPADNAPKNAEDTGGLWEYLEIADGARVMLRINLDVADGLMNGACGIVVDFAEDATTGKVTAVWVRFDRGGRRWAQAHGDHAVRIDLATRTFVGHDGQTVQRRQFPLTLAWAKTIHKSQGATEQHGIVATLDSKAAQPAMAYVALSRCQRLRDVHLTAFDPSCIRIPDGVRRALLQLQMQQAWQAPERAPAWRALFQPQRSSEDLQAELAACELPVWDAKAAALAAAREAAAAGKEPDEACQHCGQTFFGASALAAHTRRCALRPKRQRRKRARAAGAEAAA